MSVARRVHVPAVPVRGLLLRVVIAALLATACSGTEAPPVDRSPRPTAAFPVTLTDDEGVSVTIASEPQRIVTWAPSLTEILFALERGDRVVGVSGSFDDHPPQAQQIEHIGGSNFEPNVEKIVSLEADLLVDGFGGGETWKAALRNQGITVFTVLASDFHDAVEDIRTVGRLTGATGAAETVAGDLEAAAGSVEASIGELPTVSCFYEVGFEGGFFTVGPGSFIYDLLELAGCAPVTSDAADPFPQWSVEALVADDPEVYLVSSDSVGGSAESVADRPSFGSLSAVQAGRIVVIDADLLDRPGPRLDQGLVELARALHPEAF
jgi:iron complex transport system substrate-binding protein